MPDEQVYSGQGTLQAITTIPDKTSKIMIDQKEYRCHPEKLDGITTSSVVNFTYINKEYPNWRGSIIQTIGLAAGPAVVEATQQLGPSAVYQAQAPLAPTPPPTIDSQGVAVVTGLRNPAPSQIPATIPIDWEPEAGITGGDIMRAASNALANAILSGRVDNSDQMDAWFTSAYRVAWKCARGKIS